MGKTAEIRYRAIDRTLRNNPNGVSWQQLAEACYQSFVTLGWEDRQPPSRRTILEDIRTMRSGELGQSAPIEYLKGSGYRYEYRDFELNPEPLGFDDLLTLRNLVDWAEQLTYGQLPADFSDAIQRLARHLHTQVQRQVPSIKLDRPGGLDGRENMQPLHHAILSKTAVRITYQEYLSEQKEFTLSPFLLKEYNRRWFLVAYDHDAEQLWTFPLDRIITVEKLALTKFFDSPRLQPLNWLDPIIGVIRPPAEEAVEVTLLTTRLQACYFRTKPLHHSQQELTPVGTERPIFSLTIIPNPELEMQLLSFGAAVEVLTPARLREKIALQIKEAMNLYEVN
ncbi:helix-turn-helix transcriptional regulator [Neolewinella agarilytica]|uniref:helix-turn-helix transcriptional regulator n=1 Tax=Neolewinella agarilytica TaxID=478744 RepID=UPI0023538CEE|nr:WYL domain-containing protein [Neolewinella agarilytica]